MNYKQHDKASKAVAVLISLAISLTMGYFISYLAFLIAVPWCYTIFTAGQISGMSRAQIISAMTLEELVALREKQITPFWKRWRTKTDEPSGAEEG